MEQIKVTISTNTPISIRVVQSKPSNGLIKLLNRIKPKEEMDDADNKK